MEPTEKVYHLQFEHESQFREMLQKQGYTIKEETSFQYGLILNKDLYPAGRIHENLSTLKICTIIHTPEGRTLDKVLAEWIPEGKNDEKELGGEA